MTLGQKLKELRRAANLSLRELGNKIDTNFTYLSKIENDKTDNSIPSEELIKKLAIALGGDENELLFLANKIPDGDKDTILRNKEALKFYRSIKGKDISPDTWKKLMQEIEKLDKSKKTQ